MYFVILFDTLILCLYIHTCIYMYIYLFSLNYIINISMRGNCLWNENILPPYYFILWMYHNLIFFLHIFI